MAKIIYNRKECIGAASCAAVCPEFWVMNEDGKADLIGGKEISDGIFEREISDEEKTQAQKSVIACNKEAAESCPVNVIKIEE